MTIHLGLMNNVPKIPKEIAQDAHAAGVPVARHILDAYYGRLDLGHDGE